uniref:Uncharacterized protein n=1 Tax=Anguilla anguilla TaxID=7936 RepID=A0A0E9Q7N5_ANGAN
MPCRRYAAPCTMEALGARDLQWPTATFMHSPGSHRPITWKCLLITAIMIGSSVLCCCS